MVIFLYFFIHRSQVCLSAKKNWLASVGSTETSSIGRQSNIYERSQAILPKMTRWSSSLNRAIIIVGSLNILNFQKFGCSANNKQLDIQRDIKFFFYSLTQHGWLSSNTWEMELFCQAFCTTISYNFYTGLYSTIKFYEPRYIWHSANPRLIKCCICFKFEFKLTNLTD